MIAPIVERVTGRCPQMPPSNHQRRADWYAKAAMTEYPLMYGPRWDVKHRAYEREAIGTAQDVDPAYEH